MTKIILIAAGAFTVLIAILLLVIKHLKTELRVLKCQLEATEKAKDEYAAQAARLSNAADIVAKNRKEANEKISALDGGDAVDNAINELSKSAR